MVWNGYEGRQTRLLYVFIDLTGHNVRSRFSSIPISREVKHHVHVKRQTQSFPFACRLLFIISTHKLVISRYSQELSELFLTSHFLFEEFSARIWHLPFGVYVKLKLSILIVLTNKTLHWFIPSQFANKKQRMVHGQKTSNINCSTVTFYPYFSSPFITSLLH